MVCFDRFRVSLLTAIAACGPACSTEGEQLDAGTTTDPGSTTGTNGESDSQTSLGEGESGTEMEEEGTGTETETETETGEECVDLCVDPVDIGDGLVRCADGAINRAAAGGSYDPVIVGPPCNGTEEVQDCTTDAQCNAQAHGSCLSGYSEFTGVTTCECKYSCANDDDCASDFVCMPPGVVPGTPAWPSCQPASCLTNDDCPCGECGLGGLDDGCSATAGQRCRSSADDCHIDADCGDEWLVCALGQSNFYCEYSACGIGRPLLVGATVRTAGDCKSDDWAMLVTLAPDPDLAEHWARIAALEHASVASFARFAMHLLGLGAPPELLRETQRAGLDEIHHAQLAYGLASAYAERPIGPSGLELAGVAIEATWREIVGALIDEACVGETLGVAEAIAALELVEEPAVRAALEIIAEDEQRHAQLAWRCLAWLLRTANLEDRGWALARLNSTIAGLQGAVGGIDRPTDGVLGGDRRVAVHRRAITEVLEPVARVLAA